MSGKRTVLVVDDDTALLKMAEELLAESYDVSLAKSGQQAVRLLKSGFFADVILLDIDMPGMDGYQTIEAIRRIPGSEDTPVIYLTGLNRTEAELKGLNSGAVDYVTKPFVREILLARIGIHTEGGSKLRELRKNGRDGGIDREKFEESSKTLTDTERKIARLIALGCTNQEIGEELHYSYNYIKKVAVVIFEKLEVKNRSELRRHFK